MPTWCSIMGNREVSVRGRSAAVWALLLWQLVQLEPDPAGLLPLRTRHGPETCCSPCAEPFGLLLLRRVLAAFLALSADCCAAAQLIDSMARGSAKVLEQVLKLIDAFDLYGSVAYPKRHTQDDISDIYLLPAATRGVFVNIALQVRALRVL